MMAGPIGAIDPIGSRAATGPFVPIVPFVPDSLGDFSIDEEFDAFDWLREFPRPMSDYDDG
ncbi:hypothetical protein GRI38_04305 [Altererythrobacter aurantiacus]|uniref:Uncharacterized protein n=1 Tax=Parapontixanthobacter aurantiacus TaxID=1463599 RepID=A0A844ZBF6_9SPHN|nr:hypothetical protein [Parapontixanthobacter aurantiacus]MXO85245.1 hypothetical protein [Parapontixanthobacter aurantiacus]